eukprot:9454962-Pyramimonas_sp.AAC.1
MQHFHAPHARPCKGSLSRSIPRSAPRSRWTEESRLGWFRCSSRQCDANEGSSVRASPSRSSGRAIVTAGTPR